ncbi:MAG: sigma-54 dependent transcriptional regulator [Candidatus Cloacimonetes bacterium]|jgi:DNA-binding NtrC family response regulator|nr:sigma-54 dependent transcriptional regulator [Candidatus Cloacimonadota bacterium]
MFENKGNKAKILIVDDEKDTRDIFRRHLENEYTIDTAESALTAVEKLEHNSFQVVLSDLVMPGEDGLSLLKKIKKNRPEIAVMVISGKASIEMAVEAMKIGADEFIEKPVEDLDLLKIKIERLLKAKWQTDEIKRLRTILDKEFDRTHIVGNSLAIQKIMEKVKKIAPLDTTILISGETGVGKELIADLIYRNSSRSKMKFVAVNCGSLPESLLESTLFGHRKGSFTSAIKDKIGYFQEATGGTLFLDEITETTPAFQVKLLRVLEKGIIRQVGGESDLTVDVRIIAATNKDLSEEVEKGNFREDLLYRLNVIGLHIPPLRERIEDVKLLVSKFTSEFSKKYKKQELKISNAALSILLNQQWKGNIRELKNAIEHSVALASHDTIIPEDLPDNIFKRDSKESDSSAAHFLSLPYPEAKREFEKAYIETVMNKYDGDVTKVSIISGIKRQNLYDKFKRYQINPDDFRKN